MPELVPEWTGPGVALCTYIDTKNLYPNLYRYQQPGVHGMPKSKHVGWESNMKTKPLMVNYTLRMVDRDMIDIPDEDVVLEMSSYRKYDDAGDTSSYGGAAGRHDDLVSMLQIGCAVLRIRSATIPGEEEVTAGRPQQLRSARRPPVVRSVREHSGDGGRELRRFRRGERGRGKSVVVTTRLILADLARSRRLRSAGGPQI